MKVRWGALLALVLLLGLVAAGLFWQRYQSFLQRPLAVPEAGMVLEVKPGTSVAALGRRLAERGVLDDPWLLRLHVRLHPELGRIRAGEYRLTSGLRPDGLLAMLVAGRTLMHAITFPEGLEFRRWRRLIEADPHLKQTLRGLTDAEVMARLGHPGEHPEGRFFPDTYLFPRDFTDLELLQRAYQKMEKELAAAWARRQPDLPLKTPYEALILASIIEKETGVPGERRKIAGVFIRRLQKGMKLQTDPTVIYGLGERFDGNLRRRDLREDTPYNTYVHPGLPPTPICNPGRAALRAAVDPEPGTALYFVATGDGRHHFSSTLREHNQAVRKYQLKRK